MSDLVLQVGGTKLLVSVVLACAAWAVQRRVGRPGVSYPMWLMVLVILLVPAFMSVPVLPAAGGGTGLELAASGSAEAASGRALHATPLGYWLAAHGKQSLMIGWLLGTAALLGWTLMRGVRFQRILGCAMEPAPAELQRQAARIGRRLGLARIPAIHSTHARISPMVWWTGGRVRVLIPAYLLAELTQEEARSILAHELAHVRRRDYLVRWLEWIACSVFWWNPAAWWARRQLRLAEEACCDALVPGASGSSPKSYANALLRVVDVVSASPPLRAPVLASAAGGVGQTKALERRLKMIIENNTSTTPRWLRTGAWVAVICALPLGIVYCAQPDTPAAPDDAVMEAPAGAEANDAAQAGDTDDASAGQARRMERVTAFRNDLGARVEAGEITREEAAVEMAALRARMAAVSEGGELISKLEQAAESAGDDEGEASAAGAARFKAAVEQVQAMLDAGEITEEQANQRLERLRVRMAAGAARGRTPDGNR